jgi:MFS transporter, PHS family, inorganic phosphate transporter
VNFHFYLSTDGNLIGLAAIASTWVLMDWSFYFLIVNSPEIISQIWGGTEYTVLYDLLMQYYWQVIISTSIGAISGGALFIVKARSQWNRQLEGFLALALFFIIVGICFIKLLDGPYFAIIIPLYIICNFFFNFGPNASTYVV